MFKKLLPPKNYNIFIKILWYALLFILGFALLKTSIEFIKYLTYLFYAWCCYRVEDANNTFHTYQTKSNIPEHLSFFKK